MKYKLVAVDVDGTLLDSDGRISEENINTIRALSAQGVIFTIASGRHDTMIEPYVKTLGIQTPVLACNGAFVRNLTTKELISIEPIPMEGIRELLLASERFSIPLVLYTKDQGYRKDEGWESTIKAYEKYGSVDEGKVHVYEEVIENYEDVLDKGYEFVKICTAHFENSVILSFQKEIQKNKYISAVRPVPVMLDIVAQSVSKGNALVQLAKSLHIPMEEVIAIGDGENDISMLKVAGLSIAMGNGQQEVKDMADMITLTNDEAGLSYALKKVFELEL